MYQDLLNYSKTKGICLVIVSKTRTNEAILEIYELGQRVFAENRVQELVRKSQELPSDIKWHLIGHLQKNKAKHVVPIADMVQSLDSLQLAKVLNKEAEKCDKRLKVLLQIKIAGEESKTGYSYGILREEIDELLSMEFLEIRGVMGIGTFTSDEEVTRAEFQTLVDYYKELKTDFFPESSQFETISMGMSGDYELATDMGSTMVRIGSLAFS